MLGLLDRHPLWRGQAAGIQDAAIIAIVVRIHDRVRWCDADIVRFSRIDPMIDKAQREIHIDRTDFHTEDVISN